MHSFLLLDTHKSRLNLSVMSRISLRKLTIGDQWRIIFQITGVHFMA